MAIAYSSSQANDRAFILHLDQCWHHAKSGLAETLMHGRRVRPLFVRLADVPTVVLQDSTLFSAWSN